MGFTCSFSYDKSLTSSMPRLFLAYGITSVRDTGELINFLKEWKDKSKTNPDLYPRVKIAGPLIQGLLSDYTRDL